MSLCGYTEFLNQGFLQSLAEIYARFLGSAVEPFRNSHILSHEFPGIRDVAGNISEKILALSMKVGDKCRFRKRLVILQKIFGMTFKGFLCVLHDFKSGISLRKAAFQIRKLAPVAIVLKMAECRISDVHICSLRAFARDCCYFRPACFRIAVSKPLPISSP